MTVMRKDIAATALLRSGAAGLALALGLSAALAATPGDTLVVAMNIDIIKTFDPAQINEGLTADILQSICDGLVEYHPSETGKVIPKLAESWELSEDRKTVTFTLREGLTFNSGNPLTAEDVVFSMKRQIALNYPNSSKLRDLGFNESTVEDNIKALDARRVQITMGNTYPLSFMLEYLAANRAGAVVDSKLALENAKDNDWGNAYLHRTSACIGPYTLTEWRPGEAVLLTENPSYWNGAPKLKHVLIRHVAESAAQRLLLEQGDIDIARNLSATDLADLEAAGKVNVSRALTTRMYHWQFDLNDPIFANPKVRQAMRYLIDYKGLGETVMKGIGMPRTSMLPLGVLGAPSEADGLKFELDLDKAKALLAEAGYPDGFEATVLINTRPFAEAVAQSIQFNAAKVGVKLNIDRGTQQVQATKIYARSFQTGLQEWMWAIWDPHGNTSRLMQNTDNSDEAKLLGYPAWLSSYQNPEVNQKVLDAFLEGDEAKRIALYAELDVIYAVEGVTAPMFQTYEVMAATPAVKDLHWHALKVYYADMSKE